MIRGFEKEVFQLAELEERTAHKAFWQVELKERVG